MSVYGEYVFGELLKQFRVREDLSQDDLGALIGRSRTAVSLWERSLGLPKNRDIVIKLAEVLVLSETDTDLLLYASQNPLEYDTPILTPGSDSQRSSIEEPHIAEDRARYGYQESKGVEQGAKQHDSSRNQQFRSLIEEHTKNFVGREFIFNEIDAHVEDPEFPSGYIVIRGEPGIGKTALIAKMVKDYRYVHHFNIAARNIRTADAFLDNVCAQLIERYRLDQLILERGNSRDSGFFSQVLDEVAARRGGKPVRILVDALDEAEDTGLLPGVNRLFLPEILPEGVFIIVTSRPKVDYPLDVRQQRQIHMSDKDPQNEEDVRRYIRKFIRDHPEGMNQRLVEWQVNEAEFVTVMVDKSEGNFMYLVYVLGDILAGRLSPEIIDDIDHLPTGLRAYYRRHWGIMQRQDPERFETYYEPVVCILATVREPVSIAQVAEWTKLKPLRVREVITTWHEFLNDEKSIQGVPMYRLYHASFQDFLEDEVGLRPYHKLITDSALDILFS